MKRGHREGAGARWPTRGLAAWGTLALVALPGCHRPTAGREATGPVWSRPVPAAWVSVDPPTSPAARACANYSADHWRVTRDSLRDSLIVLGYREEWLVPADCPWLEPADSARPWTTACRCRTTPP